MLCFLQMAACATFQCQLKSQYIYLIFSPTYCQIANCPSSFLLCSKVPLKNKINSSLKSAWKHLSSLLLKTTDSSCQIYKKRMTTCIADSLTDLSQLVYDHRDQPSIYYSLNLLLVSCCDIGKEPNCFLQLEKKNQKSKTLLKDSQQIKTKNPTKPNNLKT